MLQWHLDTAAFHVRNGDTFLAVKHLAAARSEARRSETQRDKAIAAHCTVALQNLYPLLIVGALDHA